ncbi:MAG: isoprenoid biosynthesis glyoxalase ElbB [Candidatus Algichlamydia australiensis]|nr:isoprenoid biosynthesis glyoxalase ElbB [Chlamydiales bacterium]
MAKVAVILSGCGYLDGAEIHESVLSLLVLEQKGHTYQCFAPDIVQKKVINHLTQEEVLGQKRNVLEESARIARGRVLPLADLKADSFDAVMFPGGFGAALNLSDFAELQESCSLHPDVKVLLHQFHEEKKPILATCISPALLARAFSGKQELKMTLGSDPSSCELLKRMGMKAERKKIDEACFDEANRIYTTPCYMEPDDLTGLYKGICLIVDKL